MSVHGDILDPQGARYCPNCGATRPGARCAYCGHPFEPIGDRSPTTTAATESTPVAFTTYLKVAGWAIVWCLVVGTVLGALVDSRGLPPAVGTLGALVTMAASIRIVGRR